MFCSQCGRKLREGMLFCPFCGAEIILPEQDAEEPAVAPDPVTSETEEAETPQAGFENVPMPEEAESPFASSEVEEYGHPDSVPSRAARRQARVQVREAEEGQPADVPAPEDAPPEPLFNEPEVPHFEERPAVREEDEAAPVKANPPEIYDVQDDWRSAFDDWLQDEAKSEAPVKDGTREGAEVRTEAPDTGLRHRPASGEAVPVRRREEGTARRRSGGRRRAPVAAGQKSPRPGKASLSGGASQGTVVPRRRVAEDLFMDSTAPEPRDSYDEFLDGENLEEERLSFFFRHLRSMVGLILLAVLACIIGIYAMSGAGQSNLAKLNLAWRPEAYSHLGKESYNVGRFQQAGAYYEQALKRDPANYSYASSAAKCYLDGKNSEKAAEMLKKCIALMPTAEDPYVYLLGLYPDPVERPLEVTQLLQQGYQMTGSERLRDAAKGAA